MSHIHLFEDEDGAPYPEEVQALAREVQEDVYFSAESPTEDDAIAKVSALLVAVDKAVRKQMEDVGEKPKAGTITFKYSENPTPEQRAAYAAWTGRREIDFNDVISRFHKIKAEHGEARAIAAFSAIGYDVKVSK